VDEPPHLLTTRAAYDAMAADSHLTARLMAIHVHPGENPPDALSAANVLDADVVQTSKGWRFERCAPRIIWRSGQSPAPIEVSEK
jgi:hypothetical protein